MKVFEFYSSYYEDYCHYLFFGDDSITPKKWEIDCKKAIKESGERYLAQVKKDEGWAGTNDWVKCACDELEQMGYIRIEPTKFGVWGSGIIRTKDDSSICKFISKELLNKTIKMNQDTECDLMNDFREST